METTDVLDAPAPAPKPEGKPPLLKLSPVDWAKENLFYSIPSTVFTFVAVFGFIALLKNTIRFVFVSGRWDIIQANMTNLLVGVAFPRGNVNSNGVVGESGINEAWIALFVVTFGIAFMVGAAHRLVTQSDVEEGVLADSQSRQVLNALRRFFPFVVLIIALLSLTLDQRMVAAGLLLLMVVIGWGARTAGMNLPRKRAAMGAGLGALIILGGFFFLILNVGWEEWGGLLLTVFLASASIVLCFPIGMAAALGRRSQLPVIRMFSVAYIELIRGVPLITLLFIGSLTLTFFLPEGLVPSGVTRAVFMITLFSGAYVAEIVRGGLQAVPKGQTEAAQALGLPAFKMMRLIVMPQALRNVIPALVGQFISLFKDTSLVAIIGMRDLLLVTQGFTKQAEFDVGQNAEVLAIAAFIYWVFTFTMSRESQRLEQRLGVGDR